MTPYSLNKATEAEKKPEAFTFKGHTELKSISVPQHLVTDFVEDKIEKANTIVGRREELNRKKNTSSSRRRRNEYIDSRSKISTQNYENLQE